MKSPQPYTPRVTLDIVIPVHNQFEYLKKCLACLPVACENVIYHVYIIDNASEKQAMDECYRALDLQHHTPVVLTQNVGFGIASNYGANLGKSPFILFLNSDCFMRPGSLQRMLEVLAADAEIGVVGAKLLFPELEYMDKARPAGKIQHAGLSFSIQGIPEHVFVGWSADHPKANIPCTVPAVTGACMMLRREVWKQVGGFYEGYGLGTYEDIDLCAAVRAIPKKVWYEPTVVGEHVAGGTAIKEHINFPLVRNKFIFMGRWASMIYWSDPERY